MISVYCDQISGAFILKVTTGSCSCNGDGLTVVYHMMFYSIVLRGNYPEAERRDVGSLCGPVTDILKLCKSSVLIREFTSKGFILRCLANNDSTLPVSYVARL